MAIIHTPVKGFSGEIAGVPFVNGTGETENPAALAYFQRRGYKVEADKPAPKRTPKAAPKVEADKPVEEAPKE